MQRLYGKLNKNPRSKLSRYRSTFSFLSKAGYSTGDLFAYFSPQGAGNKTPRDLSERLYQRLETKVNPMKIGELAKLSGTSSDTLRHYEKIGLVTPNIRSTNG